MKSKNLARFWCVAALVAGPLFGPIAKAPATAEPPVGEITIFGEEKPIIDLVWRRIGDYTTTLRSVESAEISQDGRYVVSASKFGYCPASARMRQMGAFS